MTGRYFFSVILLICVATGAAQQSCNRCLYSFVTKTGIQEADATRGAMVDLIFNITNPTIISNISRNNVLVLMGTQSESFQNDTVDVFYFYGPCQLFCDMTIVFRGSIANSWNVEFATLAACLPNTGCDLFLGRRLNRTFRGPLDTAIVNFCARGVGTEKLKVTGDSLLPLIAMPSYTT